MFYFAGLYERWTPSEEQEELSSYGAGAIDTGESELVTYTILTEEAIDVVADVHERVPVILQTDEQHSWVRSMSDEARVLLERHQLPSESIRCYAVSRAVNSPSNDSPELLVELG